MPTELVSKRMRQDMILEIVKNHEVHNQLELIRHLEGRGISATQSSVSRDIHDLSIAKVDGRYVVAVLPVQGTQHGPTEAAGEPGDAMISSVTPAGPSLLVVRTPSGSADTIGDSITSARWPEVLGTVASDDTIFVATAGKHEQVRLISRLQQFMDIEPETIDTADLESPVIGSPAPQPISL